MAGRWWWTALVLVVPLMAAAEDVMPSPTPVDAARSTPWPDMEGRPVLHVERITDLKALLTVQSLLRGGGGVHPIRLLGVSGSEAWFVADSLPEGGWRALLLSEPRLRLPEPNPEAASGSLPLQESAIWDAAAQAPEEAPLNVPPVQLP